MNKSKVVFFFITNTLLAMFLPSLCSLNLSTQISSDNKKYNILKKTQYPSIEKKNTDQTTNTSQKKVSFLASFCSLISPNGIFEKKSLPIQSKTQSLTTTQNIPIETIPIQQVKDFLTDQDQSEKHNVSLTEPTDSFLNQRTSSTKKNVKKKGTAIPLSNQPAPLLLEKNKQYFVSKNKNYPSKEVKNIENKIFPINNFPNDRSSLTKSFCSLISPESIGKKKDLWLLQKPQHSTENISTEQAKDFLTDQNQLKSHTVSPAEPNNSSIVISTSINRNNEKKEENNTSKNNSTSSFQLKIDKKIETERLGDKSQQNLPSQTIQQEKLIINDNQSIKNNNTTQNISTPLSVDQALNQQLQKNNEQNIVITEMNNEQNQPNNTKLETQQNTNQELFPLKNNNNQPHKKNQFFSKQSISMIMKSISALGIVSSLARYLYHYYKKREEPILPLLF